MSLSDIPEAEPRLWHKVNAIAMTRAVVTGEPIVTKCGKKLSRFNHTGNGSSGQASDAGLEPCPVCEAIEAHAAALRDEWQQEMKDARTLF